MTTVLCWSLVCCMSSCNGVHLIKLTVYRVSMKERKKIKCLTLIDQELIEIFSLNPDESSTPFILLRSFIDTSGIIKEVHVCIIWAFRIETL